MTLVPFLACLDASNAQAKPVTILLEDADGVGEIGVLVNDDAHFLNLLPFLFRHQANIVAAFAFILVIGDAG